MINEAETCAEHIDPAPAAARWGKVEYRQAQAAFLERGLAPRDAARVSGRYVKASTVLGKLKRRLTNERKKPATAE